jgi:hypothetical protein
MRRGRRMADTIEGIPEKKLDRLKKHLLKVEKLTGRPLREKPRFDPDDCPIGNFAPDKDREGFVLENWSREVCYVEDWGGANLYSIYSGSDTIWWALLPDELKIKATKHIQGWIKSKNG